MSKWLVVTMVSATSAAKVDSPLFQVADAVAAQIRSDVLNGTVGKKTYPVENFPGTVGVDEGDILLDTDNIVLVRSYNTSPI